MSDIFPIQNGLKNVDAILKLLFITAFEYTIRKIQANQDELKLNVTHQLLAYTDDVQLTGKNILTFKKSTEVLLVNSMEMIQKKMLWRLSRCSCFTHSIQDRITNLKYLICAKFKYFGNNTYKLKLDTWRNHKQIIFWECLLHLDQNHFSFHFLSRNIKTEIYKTITFSHAVHGCGTWSLTLNRQHRLSAFGYIVLRKIFRPKSERNNSGLEQIT